MCPYCVKERHVHSSTMCIRCDCERLAQQWEESDRKREHNAKVFRLALEIARGWTVK